MLSSKTIQRSPLVVAVAFLALATIVSNVNAVVITQWTFETSIPTTAGPLAAEVGTGAATGSHASGLTVYSNPVGNGSAESYSSDRWAVGDFYQFTASSTGFEDLTISWDQTSSNTGPQDFSLVYATSVGGPFTSALSYVVLPNIATSPGVGAWNGTTANPGYTYAVDLSAVSILENAASIVFRLVMTTTDDALPPGAVATGGTSRVDNFTINGALIPPPPSAVPLPGTAVVFMLGAALAGAARKKIKAALC